MKKKDTCYCYIYRRMKYTELKRDRKKNKGESLKEKIVLVAGARSAVWERGRRAGGERRGLQAQPAITAIKNANFHFAGKITTFWGHGQVFFRLYNRRERSEHQTRTMPLYMCLNPVQAGSTRACTAPPTNYNLRGPRSRAKHSLLGKKKDFYIIDVSGTNTKLEIGKITPI